VSSILTRASIFNLQNHVNTKYSFSMW